MRPENQDLEPGRYDLCSELLRLLRHLQKHNRFVAEADTSGLSLTESHILIELTGDEDLRAADLSRIILLDKRSISRSLQELSSRKLLITAQSDIDKRRKVLHLTSNGRKAVFRFDTLANEKLYFFSNVFPKSKLRELQRFIDTLADGFRVPLSARRSIDHPLRPGIRRLTRASSLLESTAFGTTLSSLHWHILHEIHHAPLLSTVSRLATALGTSQSNVSQSVKSLELRRMLAKRSNSTDRRSSLLSLTAKGEKLLCELESSATEAFVIASAPFTSTELVRFVELLASFLRVPARQRVDSPSLTLLELSLEPDLQAARRFFIKHWDQTSSDPLPEILFGSESLCFAVTRDKSWVLVAEIQLRTEAVTLCNVAAAKSLSEREITDELLRLFEGLSSVIGARFPIQIAQEWVRSTIGVKAWSFQ